MIHLCTGLRLRPGAKRATPCPHRVRSALGLCEECRPVAPRAPASAEEQRRWSRAHREKVARERSDAGLSASMEGA